MTLDKFKSSKITLLKLLLSIIPKSKPNFMHLLDRKFQFLNQKSNIHFYNLEKNFNLMSFVMLMMLPNLMISCILLWKMVKTKISFLKQKELDQPFIVMIIWNILISETSTLSKLLWNKFLFKTEEEKAKKLHGKERNLSIKKNQRNNKKSNKNKLSLRSILKQRLFHQNMVVISNS